MPLAHASLSDVDALLSAEPPAKSERWSQVESGVLARHTDATAAQCGCAGTLIFVVCALCLVWVHAEVCALCLR